MARFLLARLAATLGTLAICSLISFSIMQLVPGDPALVLAGVGAPADTVARVREQFGLDQPVLIQLLRWYSGLLRGDLGQSVLLGRSVLASIASALPPTLSLASFAALISLVAGIGAGIVAAVNRGGWLDRLITGFAILGLSMPSFWLGLLLIVLFAVKVEWLPAGGYAPLGEGVIAWLRALVLPGISLALLQIGYIAQITRAALIEALRQDFVRTAHAKGLAPWRVVLRHALANAMLPVLTVSGIMVSLLLSGSVVIETVFSIPGLGRLMANAIQSRDYPLIQGTLLVTAAAFALVNLFVDMLYTAFDPRVRHE